MNADQLGARIRALREASGLLAADLAERVGLDATALSKIENDRRGVKSQELTQLASALGVSPLAILEPESLVGRLADTPRRLRHDRHGRGVYEELMALTELHTWLKRERISASSDLSWCLAPSPDSPLKDPEFLARAASEKLVLHQSGPDMFTSLAERIQQTLGVDVLVETRPHDVIGAAIVDLEFPLLFVNGKRTRPEALFTLAHLLGHLLAFHDKGSMVLEDEDRLEAAEADEIFANHFAAALLMPIDQIVEIIEGSNNEFERSFLTMIEAFGVGPDLVAYRLMSLDFISAEAFDQLRELNLERLAMDLGGPGVRSSLSALQIANLQARAVTPPPAVRPAILINRATKAFHRGLIAASPLAHLRDVPVELVLEEGQRVREAEGVASEIEFTRDPVDSAKRSLHDSVI